jgi:hypothetical protein
VLGRNRNADVHMVCQEVPFDDLALLLPGQSVENLPQLTARLPEDCFAPPLGVRIRRDTCSPISNGIGFGKAQT